MAKEESVEIHSHERHFKEIGAKEKEQRGRYSTYDSDYKSSH